MKKIMLKDLAYARSGDKGDISDLGLIAKTDKDYELMKKNVTPEAVKEFFKDDCKGEVSIYPMDNINALKIVMWNALGGGATRNLRLDQTGKSMGCYLLGMEIDAA